MLETLLGLPWAHIVVGYAGFALYLLTSLANPADESLGSLRDVFVGKGRTVLAGAVVTPMLVLMAQSYEQLNAVSAFTCGYMNISLMRKASETWVGRSKLVAP